MGPLYRHIHDSRSCYIIKLMSARRPNPIQAMLKNDLAFIQAASQGRLEDMERALSLGANPKSLLPGGQSGLHMACCNGHPHVAARLLSLCDPLGVDDLGQNALHKAVGYGHPECAAVLLASEHACDFIGMRDHAGRTPWLSACSRADLPCIELLAATSSQFDARDDKGDGALHLAANHGETSSIEFILGLSIFDIDEPGSGGATAFMQACQLARIDAARLLAPLCDTQRLDENGRDALCLLTLHCQEPQFLTPPPWAQGIHDQLARHELDTAKLLLSLGLLPDGPEPGNSLLDPLLISCMSGNAHLAHILFHASSMPGGREARASELAEAARARHRDELAGSIESWGLALYERDSIDASARNAPSLKSTHL